MHEAVVIAPAATAEEDAGVAGGGAPAAVVDPPASKRCGAKKKATPTALQSLRASLEAFAGNSDVKLANVFQHMARTCSTSAEKQDTLLCNLLVSHHLTPEEVAGVLDTRVRLEARAARDEVVARLVRDTDPAVREEAFRLLRMNVLKASEVGADRGGRDVTVRSMLRTGRPPSEPQIKNLVDKISTWTTLMLGFTQGNYRMVPTTVLAAADLRWEGWCANETLVEELLEPRGWCDEAPSLTLFRRAMLSFCILVVTLFLIIAVYVSMNWAELADVDKDARARWWHSFRWAIYLSLIGWLGGVMSLLWTNSAAVRVVYDQPIEDLLTDPSFPLVWYEVQWWQWGAVAGVVVAIFANAVMSAVWDLWLTRRNVQRQNAANFEPGPEDGGDGGVGGDGGDGGCGGGGDGGGDGSGGVADWHHEGGGGAGDSSNRADAAVTTAGFADPSDDVDGARGNPVREDSAAGGSGKSRAATVSFAASTDGLARVIELQERNAVATEGTARRRGTAVSLAGSGSATPLRRDGALSSRS